MTQKRLKFKGKERGMGTEEKENYGKKQRVGKEEKCVERNKKKTADDANQSEVKLKGKSLGG